MEPSLGREFQRQAFARLIYERLDTAHNPVGVQAESALHTLRQVSLDQRCAGQTLDVEK